MRRIAAGLLLTLVAVLTLASAAVAQQVPPWRLAYRWTRGETLKYRLTATIKGSIPFMGSPEPVEIEGVIRMVYAATPVVVNADGSADVEFRVQEAEVEVAKVPFPVPIEEAQKILDQTATFSRFGEVIKVIASEKELPQGVSFPGVDPKKLFTLLYPIVFKDGPVGPGDRWPFKGSLLGGDGAAVSYTAVAEPPLPKPTAAKPGKPASRPAPAPVPTLGVVRVGQQFSMTIDQRLDAAKHVVAPGASAHKARKGTITGTGVFRFDTEKGRFVSGQTTLNALIVETLVGKPIKKGELARVVSKVRAVLALTLLPAGAQPAP